jgi:SpoVK/Ycf46/Vps4 family AAA+-type ATPase
VDTRKVKSGLIRSPSVPSAKVNRVNSRTSSPLESTDDEEADDNDSIDEDEWIQAARKKIKGKGIDENAANQIFNDVVVKGDPVYWDDIAGLDQAKISLKETVVYPFLRPDLFRGLREPAQGILLFGPPGTGKTMLARAVAQESQSTFFSISASSLTSKFLGESEKLVRALFLMARALAPAIIFVDEIDSLLSARSDTGEHETSRRIKTEFLVQWSALQHAAAGKEHEDVSRVLVLAATNLPWVIDEAARRRFVRRQYIPLPEPETRERHLEKLLSHQKNSLTTSECARLVRMTDGFSGSDLTALAKDAAMGPLRELGEALLTTPTEKIRPIGFQDFEASLKTIRPSVSLEGLKIFEDWATMYGSSGA